MRPRQRGFTLLELALVLLVITVLLGGLAVPFTRQIETRRIAETQKAMATIQDALIGYAMSHSYSCTCSYDSSGAVSGGTCPKQTTPPFPGACPSQEPAAAGTTLTFVRHYLPCPTWSNDGLEPTRNANGNCPLPPPGNPHVGFLPWATLGVPETDAWGNRYAYDVYLPYADAGLGDGFSTSWPPDPSNPQDGQLYVCSTSGCALPPPAAPPAPSPYVAVQVPAVVISYGPDGEGSYSANNNQWAVPPPTSEPDELQNATYMGSQANRAYVSHPPTADGSPKGQFDDLVTWLSWSALVNRVCPAGGCP